MPKNKKPAGGRPARDFDPARGKRSGGAKAGSRSPGHRGYRPDEAPKKARWTRDERLDAGRSPHRADREGRGERMPEGRRTGGSARPSYDRADRPSGGRDARDGQRDGRRFDRDERRPYDRGDRPDRSRGDRSFDGARDGGRRSFDDRPRRSSDRDDRARSYDRGDRPNRFDRDDRPGRFDRDDRRRSYDRDDRPRSYDRDDRPRRSFDRDDRAPRTRDERPRSYDRGDRPQRSFDRTDRTDRPARSFDRDRADRPQRGFDRDDRRRSFDRPGFRDSERRPSSYYPAKGEQRSFGPEDDVVLERLEAQAVQADATEGTSFADLGLGQNIVRTLAELGAESPFPIQAATIPVVLEGRDVLGRGRTGSGKTIAFGAPTVERLMQDWAARQRDAGGERDAASTAGLGKNARKRREMGRAPRALILAPTRELALQIDRTVQPIAQSVGLFTTQIYGGVPQGRQVGALQRGVDIVIGTPGRIEDLVEQGRLDLSQVRITVLDEADHMCDLGFLEPVQRIIRRTADGGQKLLFSATLDTGVAALVDEFLVDPAVYEVAGEDQASSTIEHHVLVIDNREKRDIVAALADRDGKTLVFSRTRAFAEDLTDHLEDAGIAAVALHGDLNQSRRTRNLQQLTSGRVDVLVATDVAARGIHVDDIDLVIQADAPDEYKTYLHRAGRTGRAGKAGRVVTLIPRNRQRRMAELLGRAEIDVDFEDVYLGDPLLAELAEAPLAPSPEPETAPEVDAADAPDPEDAAPSAVDAEPRSA
ncbi:DEAD/DEAH box helicase [Agromyces archimandritae]|uniref:DEAD/DEAH box helicase n=1 Tax=Agromyces archimandritae TaxID=2781962 RepID=A0A975FNK2_9MICO|nr:DEAD/DEAH box helicase [Agromyces archimandritae]QTX05748.1 DEAD/DEAH box helicase [Agromyces archimandritae]